MRFHMKPFTAQQGVGCRLPRAYVRCIRLREYLLPLRPMGDGLMAHTLYEDRDLNSSQELFDDLAGIKTDPEMVQLATQQEEPRPTRGEKGGAR